MQNILIGDGPKCRWVATVKVLPENDAELNVYGIYAAGGLFRFRREGSKFLYVRTPPFYTIEYLGKRKSGVRTLNLRYLEGAYKDERTR